MRLLHSYSACFQHFTPQLCYYSRIHARAQCAQKAGKYTNKFRTNQTFRLIFRHLALVTLNLNRANIVRLLHDKCRQITFIANISV